MTSSVVLVDKGLRALEASLGTVEAERSIYTIKTDDFDYTKWQQEHYADITVKELNTSAAGYMQQHPELTPQNAKIVIE